MRDLVAGCEQLIELLMRRAEASFP